MCFGYAKFEPKLGRAADGKNTNKSKKLIDKSSDELSYFLRQYKKNISELKEVVSLFLGLAFFFSNNNFLQQYKKTL